jgi:PAS domain S-box-containing protein
VGRNSRKKLVGASRPQKSASLVGKDKRAEERQRKLNETLAVLFKFAPDAIIVVDEGGCIVRVNDQARAMFGYTTKEFLGKRIEMLMPARFRKRHVGHQKRYMANRVYGKWGRG